MQMSVPRSRTPTSKAHACSLASGPETGCSSFPRWTGWSRTAPRNSLLEAKARACDDVSNPASSGSLRDCFIERLRTRHEDHPEAEIERRPHLVLGEVRLLAEKLED